MNIREKKQPVLPVLTDTVDDPKVEAARFQLRRSFTDGNALETVREIIANLLGSEEMGLYRVDHSKAVLWLYWSFGIDPKKLSMLDILTQPVIQHVMDGDAFVDRCGAGELEGTDQSVTAFIPIRYKARTVAVLAVFGLLAQKNGLDDSDLALFSVLANEAGKPLFDPRSKSFVSRPVDE